MGSPLRCPLSCPLFSYLEVVDYILSCQLSCPLFPYMEVVGSLICMAKFPWAAHSVAHVQPMRSEVGSSPVFFLYGYRFIIYFKLLFFYATITLDVVRRVLEQTVSLNKCRYMCDLYNVAVFSEFHSSI